MTRILPALLLLTACSGEPAPTPHVEPHAPDVEAEAAVPENVQKAIEIASAIRATPDDAEAVLAEHGMTAEDLEALLFEIAADPAQSAAYAEGMGG